MFYYFAKLSADLLSNMIPPKWKVMLNICPLRCLRFQELLIGSLFYHTKRLNSNSVSRSSGLMSTLGIPWFIAQLGCHLLQSKISNWWFFTISATEWIALNCIPGLRVGNDSMQPILILVIIVNDWVLVALLKSNQFLFHPHIFQVKLRGSLSFILCKLILEEWVLETVLSVILIRHIAFY